MLVNYFKFKLQKMVMSKVIEVIYENGVFKPLEKVDLKEGERVKVIIEKSVEHLVGKYGRRKVNLLELRDEIYDRRCHIHR